MFSFAVSSNYFIEIAKLRAARILFAKLVEAYKPVDVNSIKIFIHCYTSTYNKTLYDPYNNVLRATTETMSAAIGGAESVTVLPYDMIYRKPDEYSYRISRNTQLILKNESYLDKIVDSSAGSYYIENLTESIAQAAWNLFREVEAKGGYIEAIKQNFVQNRIEETVRKRNEQISAGKQTILGTNKYPNPAENIIEQVDNEYIRKWGVKEVKKVIKTLSLQRSADIFESIRLTTERFVSKGNRRPSVFLFTIGNRTMRRARAGFSANFFGCCGYEVIDNIGFNSVDEGLTDTFKINPDIVIICSSDDEYASFAPEITRKIKANNPKTTVIIAGNPENIINELKNAGVDDFISIKTNIAETLIKYQKKLINISK